jgi:hypothetical protein
MFGLADLVTCAVLKDGLQFLADHPAHLEFILGSFVNIPELKSLVGAEHIKECIEFITTNRMHVAPFYQIDIKKRPALSVVSSGSENVQFIGDYGSVQESRIVLPPRTYQSWDAKEISKCTMKVAKNLELEKKLWVGLVISNGTHSAILKGILVRDGEDTTLYLDREWDENPRLTGWSAQSDNTAKGYVVHSSMDDVRVQVKLTTNGDYTVHRLMSIVTRYCLKRGRLMFDRMGMQVATFNYTPPMLTDNTEFEFESVFTIDAKMMDSWIYEEFFLNDRTANVLLSTTVQSEESQDVVLD